MKHIRFPQLVRSTVITCNILLIGWVLYNGIDSGWQGTIPEKISFTVLVALLCVNSFIVYKWGETQS